MYFQKKLEEFGKDHTKHINDAVSLQGQYMQAKSTTAAGNPSNQDATPDVGRKLTFDNLDYRQEVHYMTEDHQNVDKHCVTVMSTENRVSGNHLSDVTPEEGVLGMENGKCLPDHSDSVKQRLNYIDLVGRIITAHIPCLAFLSDVAKQHIPHQYKDEMRAKTDTVSYNSSTFILQNISIPCKTHQSCDFTNIYSKSNTILFLHGGEYEKIFRV